MLPIYDYSKFSKSLSSIRKTLGFSLQNVCENTGISKTTLISLEQGKNLPRIDTLYILSSFYKLDLVRLFTLSIDDFIIKTHYNLIDILVSDNNYSETTNLLKETIEYLSEHAFSVIESKDLKQIEFFLKGLLLSTMCVQDKTMDVNAALDKYYEALRVKNSSFRIENYKSFKYYAVEYSIIYSIAVIMGLDRQCCFSNELLFFTLKYLESVSEDISYYPLVSKIYSNISYNYHRLDQHDLALKFAELGILFCIKNDTFLCLPLLLGRKGVAQYYLKKFEWEDSIQKAIVLLDIQNKDEMKKIYEQIYSKYKRI